MSTMYTVIIYQNFYDAKDKQHNPCSHLTPMTGDQAQEQGLGEEYITYSSKTQNRKKKYSGTIKISTVCLKINTLNGKAMITKTIKLQCKTCNK